MRSPVANFTRIWWPTVLMSLLGIVLGVLLRGRAGEASEMGSSPTASDAIRVDHPFRSVGSSQRRDRLDEEPLTFTRLQWRTLQRDRPSLLVRLEDCLTWTREVEVPVQNDPGWGTDGYVIQHEGGGPDLNAIARFLGLDEPRTEKLRHALQRFGASLRDVEQQSLESEYRGDGTLRLTFGNGTVLRREVFAQLDVDLLEALGPRDAGRFLAATDLIPNQNRADHLELRALKRGDLLFVGIPGLADIGTTDLGAGMRVDDLVESVVQRVAHLELDVDWNRLIKEARSKGE